MITYVDSVPYSKYPIFSEKNFNTLKDVLRLNTSLIAYSNNCLILSQTGIDLAKDVFQIHGADAHGKRVLTKRVGRKELIELMSNFRPCVVGIEACTGAHYWARLFGSMGHTVKMMAPQFVKPYVMSNKNDRNDAKGIAEAVTRPEMKFVPIKTVEQQDILLLHRARELCVKNRTAQSNQIRGLLAEFGVIVNKGLSEIRKLPEILDLNKDKLSVKATYIFEHLYEQFKTYEEQVLLYEKDIEAHVKSEPICKEILKIEGIGPMTHHTCCNHRRSQNI